jgi:hypothetical protein
MEIRYTYTQTLFSFVGGIVVADYFDAPWWGYMLAAPALSALAYVLWLWWLRRLDMKPTILFADYVIERKKRWQDDRDRRR